MSRGAYGCGFLEGDTVRLKHGRKRYRLGEHMMGVSSARSCFDLLVRGKPVRYAVDVDRLALVRKAA